MWTASIRRSQVTSAEGDVEDLEFFQRKVSDRFSNLLPPHDSSSSTTSDALISIAWLRKLLDAFLCCEDEFRATILMARDPSHIVKSPLDCLIPELLDRTVKSLDICNAITHDAEAVQLVQKHAEIAVADGPSPMARAKKALATVLSSIAIDEKESNASRSTERSWSFGRRGTGSTTKDSHITNF